MPGKQQKPPDESSRQQANELIRLIRKLRWMGMEEEAKRAQAELDRCNDITAVVMCHAQSAQHCGRALTRRQTRR